MFRCSLPSWTQLSGVIVLALGLTVAAATGIWAGPLDDAKAAGLVGERPDGFVAAVPPNPSPDIRALVDSINAKRQAAYADIGQKENVPVSQVGALAAEKIKRQAPAGSYFMNSDGSWSQK